MHSHKLIVGVLLTALGGGAVLAAAGPSFHFPASAAQTKKEAGAEVKTFALPPGTARIITFKSGDTAYKLDGEVQFYVLKGAVEATVDGKDVTLAEGDVVSGPTGAIKHKGAEAIVIAHKVESAVPAPKPAVVRGADTPAGLQVQWMQDGKPQAATTEEAAKAAPKDAARFNVKRYTFDGNSIRVITFQKGGNSNPSVYQQDNILYMSKGHMKRHVGDQVADVKAGDVVQEQLGTTGYWEVLEDSQLVSTTALVTKK